MLTEFGLPSELLLDPNLEAVRALADLCHLDRVPLATSLLRVFRLVST
jgi:Ras GTPase-activating protein 1